MDMIVILICFITIARIFTDKNILNSRFPIMTKSFFMK